MVSLLHGMLSQVATLRRATRALASYQRTDGSLACPCFAAFCVSLPAHVEGSLHRSQVRCMLSSHAAKHPAVMGLTCTLCMRRARRGNLEEEQTVSQD